MLPSTPLDPADGSLPIQAFLADLQGNILHGHGRTHVAAVLVEFTSACAARALLRALAPDLTTALTQYRTRQDWHLHKIEEPTFYSVVLSKEGYASLGIDPQRWPGHLPGKPTNPFADGMLRRESELAPQTQGTYWEAPYKKNFHAMFLIADWRVDRRNLALTRLVNRPDWLLAVSRKHVEYGDTLFNAAGQRVEHFGFADGISQPLFLRSDIEAARRRVVGSDDWNPAMQLNVVLREVSYEVTVPGSGTKATTSGYGSFLVFRKLAQNVEAFHEFTETTLKNELGTDFPGAERAAAWLIGRSKNGTPLTLHDSPQALPPQNDFNYFSPRDNGRRCPYHAHARKSNPRDPIQANVLDRIQIARRGITYGQRRKLADHRTLDETDRPAEGVGLLFMAYMADIADQFEHMQMAWLNDPAFESINLSTVDPIVGETSKAIPKMKCPVRWDDATSFRAVAGQRLVTPLGGEYFFAPPIGFLRELV